MTAIDLKKITPELFLEVAEDKAKAFERERGRNESSQLRKFYNEVCQFEEKLTGYSNPKEQKEQFDRIYPLLCMLVPKAVYAKTRKHVDDNFVTMMRDCIKQVNSPETLRNFRLFFEAIIAYLPKNK